MFDKISVIYNKIRRNMVGNNLLKSARENKARDELEISGDVTSQNGVHIFSSQIEKSDEVIDKYQGKSDDQVV